MMRPLELAGALSAAVAAVHVVMVLIGPTAYRYFGAGEAIARQAEDGSLFPAALTLSLAALFAIFALYAFAGAGRIRRLPFLRIGLVAIGALYLLRGLLLIPQLVHYVEDGRTVLPRELFFSSVSLIIGVAYLIGTIRAWRALPSRAGSSW